MPAPGVGFKCAKCPSGFIGDGKTCTDIDDCSNKNNPPCGAGPHLCIDTGPNAHTCICFTGYSYLNGKCVHINNCNNKTKALCTNHTLCNQNSRGQAICSCKPGFTNSSGTCVDTDGCVKSPCFPGSKCHDEAAPKRGFRCGACPSGYVGDGEQCHDIDDCATTPCGYHKGLPHVCVDQGGGKRYTCVCLPGFTFAGGKCEPATKCSGSWHCHSKATCHKGDHGNTCSCSAGYVGNGTYCKDDDGCADGPCFKGLACKDVAAPGVGFTCPKCPPGYIGNGVKCSDVDDCDSVPCGVDLFGPLGTCTDTGPLSYACKCKKGYVFTGGRCRVHHPCQAAMLNKCGVNATCNSGGLKSSSSKKSIDYTCECKSGYVSVGKPPCVNSPSNWSETKYGDHCSVFVGKYRKLMLPHCGDTNSGGIKASDACCGCGGGKRGQNITCHEEDGCANSPCFKNVTCHDVRPPGTGFKCDRCPRGFTGDGRSCHDIDDCSGNPCGVEHTCVDLGVSKYICKCQPGFTFINKTCEILVIPGCMDRMAADYNPKVRPGGLQMSKAGPRAGLPSFARSNVLSCFDRCRPRATTRSAVTFTDARILVPPTTSSPPPRTTVPDAPLPCTYAHTKTRLAWRAWRAGVTHLTGTRCTTGNCTFKSTCKHHTWEIHMPDLGKCKDQHKDCARYLKCAWANHRTQHARGRARGRAHLFHTPDNSRFT